MKTRPEVLFPHFQGYAKSRQQSQGAHQLLREGGHWWVVDACPLFLRVRPLTGAENERTREVLREVLGLAG